MKKTGFIVGISLFFLAGMIMLFNTPNKEQISAKTYKNQILTQMSHLKEVKLSDDVVLTDEDFQLNELTNLDYQATNIKYIEEASNTITYLLQINEVVELLVRGTQVEKQEQDKSFNHSHEQIVAAIQSLNTSSYLIEKPTFKQGEKVYEIVRTLNKQFQTHNEQTNDIETNNTEKKREVLLDTILKQYQELLDVFFNDYYPSVYEMFSAIGYEGVKPIPVDKETLKLNLINYISISNRYYEQTHSFLDDAMAYFELFNIMKEYDELVVLTSGTGHFAFTKDIDRLNEKIQSVKHLNRSLTYDVQLKAERLNKTSLTFNPLLVEKLVLADIELKQYYLILNEAQRTENNSNLDEQLGQQFMILHGLMQSIYKDLQDGFGEVFYDMSQQIVAVST